MIVLLNGPLGMGKSTLGAALAETIDGCVFLDGDSLVAANPPLSESEQVHCVIAVLVGRLRRNLGLDG